MLHVAIFFPFTTLLNSRSYSINTERDGECKLSKCKGDKIRIRTTGMILKLKMCIHKRKDFVQLPYLKKV